MKQAIFTTDCYYHVYNRGVEKRTVFQEDKDYKRFLLCLEEFNTSEPTHIASLPVNAPHETNASKKLVDIICFCLMPNHYHLIVKQAADKGITQFMRKLATGYTMYFNKKWERGGLLFDGKFKAKIIENDEYLLHLSRYIHLNPLDLINPLWKESGIKDTEAVKKFLEGYRWSSYSVYTKRSKSALIILERIENILMNVANYEKFVTAYTAKEINEVLPLLIESRPNYEVPPR